MVDSALYQILWFLHPGFQRAVDMRKRQLQSESREGQASKEDNSKLGAIEVHQDIPVEKTAHSLG